MAVKLVVLKSGEDIIADVKEIQSETSNEVIGYYFYNPLILKLYSREEKPVVLSEEEGTTTETGTTKEFSSKIGVTFYPWIPLSGTREIPCSADWVVTIVEPQEQVTKMYQERVNGRPDTNDDKDSIVIDE